ncbi:MAG: PocR ligand-binding domain-containing protein [Alphaproteobacteria bacterium]|nr:PocR ligand-binding domain-containing protein [Alphaproteobacteria bacterium]
MKLTDILPAEIWASIETQANGKFGLSASVFDAEGKRVTKQQNVDNPLCRAISQSPDGQIHICARSHQNISGRAQIGGAPVIGECDAGLIKISVPIFIEDEFMGSFGGCGLLPEGEEIDAFYIGKITGMAEADIEEMGKDIETISRVRSEEVAEFLAGAVGGVFDQAQKAAE